MVQAERRSGSTATLAPGLRLGGRLDKARDSVRELLKDYPEIRISDILQAHWPSARKSWTASRKACARQACRNERSKEGPEDLTSLPALALLLLVLALQQRGDPAHGHPAVLPLGRLRIHLQVLLAIALGRQVLGGDLEAFGEDGRNRLGSPVGEGQVVLVRADRIGVAFDQEDLVRVVETGPTGSPGRYPSERRPDLRPVPRSRTRR